MIINDYDLAEISLVDHPANYDAKLDLSIDSAFRQYAREKGIFQAQLDWPTKSMTLATAKKDITPVENPIMEKEITPEVEVVADAPVAEVPAPVEPEIVAEVVVAVEPEVAAPVVEETAEVVVPEPVVADKYQAQLDVLSASIAEIAKMVTALVSASKAVEPTEQVETSSEKALNDEQPVVSDPDVEKTALLAENAELKEKVLDMSTPTERKGALPVEELPTEEVAKEDGAAPAETKAIGLRLAVKRFAESHH